MSALGDQVQNLRTLQQSYDTLTTNVSAQMVNVATEANATSNKTDIIEHIDLALQANMTAMGISGLIGVEMDVIQDDEQTTIYTLDANKIYYFAQRTSDLTITLNLTSVDVGDVPNFHMIIDCRNATPLTVVIKDSQNNNVAWGNLTNPEFKNGFMYEIGILNNLALYVKYEV